MVNTGKDNRDGRFKYNLTQYNNNESKFNIPEAWKCYEFMESSSSSTTASDMEQ